MTENILWYKEAIFYELNVRAFCDSNGDGRGDLAGAVEKLDYLKSLGVDCIWLLPIYPSPLRDDGYDISDYCAIREECGTMADFERLIAEAHKRGMRVITDLVINHTSDQHPWFQESRRSRDNPKHDWYVWSDTDALYPKNQVRIIFQDIEKSNWTYDETRKQYYWHRFYAHQPDLNYDNPDVQQAILDVMRFWLDRGIDGFRVDAVPYLFEREGTNCENLPETHVYLRKMRRFVDEHYPEALLLCEANQPPKEVVDYFGTPEAPEFHMGFHFPIMPRIFMALRQQDTTKIREIMGATPPIPDNCQWCTFLRNHDELTLEMVSEEERQWMWREYASDQNMRLNLGIRRRLAPLLDNNLDKIMLANRILFSLPGAPIIYYGDEIGMGDDIKQPDPDKKDDRNGVRTPMQWDNSANAGFSRAPAERLYHRVIADPVYGYRVVNVTSQQHDPQSLLYHMRELVAQRKRYKAFALGTLRFLETQHKAVLAFVRASGDETFVVVHNLSQAAQTVLLDLGAMAGRRFSDVLNPVETFPQVGAQPYPVHLPALGSRWLLLRK